MIYKLKNCRDGSDAPYETTVEITEEGNVLVFKFTAEHTKFYCPHHNYNDIHSEGDACEVLIGTDPERKLYYEIEISPENQLMCALMENKGDDENGVPILEINFIDELFVQSKVHCTETSYEATIRFSKENILSGDGEIYFNAYRLETDGGETDKHLMALNPTMKPKFHSPSHFLWLKDYLK